MKCIFLIIIVDPVVDINEMLQQAKDNITQAQSSQGDATAGQG